jgi:hypothetical protein
MAEEVVVGSVLGVRMNVTMGVRCWRSEAGAVGWEYIGISWLEVWALAGPRTIGRSKARN